MGKEFIMDVWQFVTPTDTLVDQRMQKVAEYESTLTAENALTQGKEVEAVVEGGGK